MKINTIFDTNILFTNDAYKLFSYSFKQLLSDYSGNTNVEITWYMPDVVLHERQYQIRKKAEDNIAKLTSTQKQLKPFIETETVFNDESIDHQIENIVNDDINEAQISIFNLNSEEVNWRKMIIDACYRNPPFEDLPDKEKGFRDALIKETMIQFVSHSSTDASIISLLVVKDKILREALEAEFASIDNARVFRDLVECRSFLNIVLATQNEENINKLVDSARLTFYDPSDLGSIYFSHKIREKITSKFVEKLRAPEPKQSAGNIRWSISNTGFEKVDDSRAYFFSNINAYYEILALGHLIVVGPGIGSDYQSISDINLDEYHVMSQQYDTYMLQRKRHIGSCNITFQVKWNASIENENKLKDSKISNIDFIEEECEFE